MQKRIIATVILSCSSLISTALAIEPTSLPPTKVLKKTTQLSGSAKAKGWGGRTYSKTPKKINPRRLERAFDDEDDERNVLKKRTR